MLDKLYQPEYTGINRCWSCAVTNLVVLLIICATVFVLYAPAAIILGAIGIILIWARGYFLPFTPIFAPAVASVLPFSFKRGESVGSLSGRNPSGDAVSQLYDLDVLVGDGMNLELNEDFVKIWKEEAESLKDVSGEELALRISREAPTVDEVEAFERNGEVEIIVSSDRRPMSREVAVTELSGILALKEYTNIGPRSRVEAAGPLRTFLDFCPICGGRVERREKDGSEVLVCNQCGEVFHTYED